MPHTITSSSYTFFSHVIIFKLSSHLKQFFLLQSCVMLLQMPLIVWRQFSTCSGWHSTPNLSLIAWPARANDPGINVLDGLFPLVASLASISIIKHCICFDHLNCSLILSSSSFVLPIATVARTRRVIKIEHTNTKNYMWKLYLLSTRKFYYQNEGAINHGRSRHDIL